MNPTLELPTLEPIVNPVAPGFRLQRFELLNWGTFDSQPRVVDLQGGVALLTGANGSGKSTLVDGLLTLLVPNQRRNYNQASSAAKKKERSEKSYIQGAYGRTQSEESYGSKLKLLREQNPLSVLLAYFCDRATGQVVTLAQVLWLRDGSVEKFFVIAEQDLTIAANFLPIQNISDLKKKLKTQGMSLFNQFSQYSQQFRKRLGLQSEKALDLFNQTVSIKEVGSLNQFVRNHMLEKTDVKATIAGLQESYEHLTVCYTAIQQAREQLEALLPLSEEHQKYQNLTTKITKLTDLQAILPLFFAQEKFTLLEQALEVVARKLSELQDRQADCDRRVGTLREDAKNLEFAIKNDQVGRQLQELKREINILEGEVKKKQAASQNYDERARRLGFESYGDRATFYANRSQGEARKQEIAEHLTTLQSQRDDQITQKAEIKKQHQHIAEELDSLRRRESQIPQKNLAIRDRIAEALEIESSELPFVGELLKVREEAQVWEGAIERLLHNFALHVLVPPEHYRRVNDYVRRTHLRGRLTYFHVQPLAPNPTQRAMNPWYVPQRLDIKPESGLFGDWLRERLVKQFNYVCCENVQDFEHEPRAITPEGLIKHGQARHEKDDRSKVGDRSQYVLGWSNARKIQALETELDQINLQLSAIELSIQQVERQQKQRQRETECLQDLMNVLEFAEIDWRSLESDRLELERRRTQLEANSEQLQQLQTQLEQTEAELTKAQRDRDGLLQDIRSHTDEQERYRRSQQDCQALREQAQPADLERFSQQLARRLKSYTLTLASIDAEQNELRDFLQQETRKRERQQESSKNALMMRMLNFKTAFPETVSELDTTLDSLPEYLKLQTKIEQDDLPRHERRFKALMNDKIVSTIVEFKSQLERQEEDIEQAVAELNTSLKRINYSSSTYIELRCDKTRHREVRDFQADLRTCLGDAAEQTPEANERRFQEIQKRLIERFKGDDRWTKLVTDVRNWLDFSVSERYCDDGSEKEHHTDSSGKSGGQKVKLAYTILASAIAYQFGLHQDTQNPKSFRFVVIDEIFSKSDESNSRYVMELFENLELQLFFITPKDKINVVEPYISSLHFVANTPQGNNSTIASLSVEQYRQKRQQTLLT